MWIFAVRFFVKEIAGFLEGSAGFLMGFLVLAESDCSAEWDCIMIHFSGHSHPRGCVEEEEDDHVHTEPQTTRCREAHGRAA